MSASSLPAHTSASESTATTAAAATIASSASSVSNAGFSFDDLNFPVDVLTTHDHKDEALRALKSDLMDELNEEVKSLDDDGWMFEGPRSRINLVSRPGSSFSTKADQISSLWQSNLPR